MLLVGLQQLRVRWLPTRTPAAAAAPTRFVLGPSRRRGATRNRPNVRPLVNGCVEECSRRKEVPERPPNSPFLDHVSGSLLLAKRSLKVCPSAPISRGGSYRSASGRRLPAAALCSQEIARRATLRPRRRKNKIPLAAPKRARAPPCPTPQPPPRERHAPQYPARRRYAPRARPQKCSRRTGETATAKTTYAGSHRARTPQRRRPRCRGTAARPTLSSARPKPTTRRDRRRTPRQPSRPRVPRARAPRPPLGERTCRPRPSPPKMKPRCRQPKARSRRRRRTRSRRPRSSP